MRRFQIPNDVRDQLLQAEAACGELSELAGRFGLNHQFTLDGRFVGDVGELLVARNFAVKLHTKQQSRHDGKCVLNEQEFGVQIKCRRKSTVIDFTSQPQLLLVLQIDEGWERCEIVYNGPGDFLTLNGTFTINEKGHLFRAGAKHGRRFFLRDLADLDGELPPDALRVPTITVPAGYT